MGRIGRRWSIIGLAIAATSLPEARRSARAALIGGLYFVVHGWIVWLIALGLAAFGATCLLIAVGTV